MIYILDAGAIIAYLRKEPGGVEVRGILNDPSSACVIHAVNLCEIFYDAYRSLGEHGAREAIDELLRTGLVLRDDLSPAFWQAAGRIKAVHRRVSLADCFAIALAQSMGGTVLTCDHHEFDAVASANLCPVTFIR